MQTKQGLENLTESSSKLTDLMNRQKSTLDAGMYEGVNMKVDLTDRQSTRASLQKNREGMSKLSAALQESGDIKQRIADYNAGLSSTLGEMREFLETVDTYQGFGEKLFNFVGMRQTADKLQGNRIAKQKIEENLHQIVNINSQMHAVAVRNMEESLKRYEAHQNHVTSLVETIATYQPQEEKLREKLTAMKSEREKLQKKYDLATAQEQIQLSKDINTYDQNMAVVELEYRDVFGIYDKAKQLLPLNKEVRDSVYNMTMDLQSCATTLRETMKDVLPIYQGVSKVNKILRAVKGVSITHAASQKTTEAAGKFHVRAAEGIHDEVASMIEKREVADSVIKEIVDTMAASEKNFISRVEAARALTNRTNEEIYASGAASAAPQAPQNAYQQN
jgi:hypothetical protein